MPNSTKCEYVHNKHRNRLRNIIYTRKCGEDDDLTAKFDQKPEMNRSPTFCYDCAFKSAHREAPKATLLNTMTQHK